MAEQAGSPLEQAIGAEALERYERALARLAAADREAVIARLELGLTYAELAQALGRPSPDAARMMVARAMVRLAGELRNDGSESPADRPGSGNR
jgi:RNA polymerase sigma-70 factor (ECF subfamily)